LPAPHGQHVLRVNIQQHHQPRPLIVSAVTVLLVSTKRRQLLRVPPVTFVQLAMLFIQHQLVVQHALPFLQVITRQKTTNRLLPAPHGQHVLRVDLLQQLRQHQHLLIALVMIARQENFKLRVRLQAIPVHTAKPVDLMLVRLLRVITVRVVNFKIKAVRHQ
jgi:hypothetical protein